MEQKPAGEQAVEMKTRRLLTRGLLFLKPICKDTVKT